MAVPAMLAIRNAHCADVSIPALISNQGIPINIWIVQTHIKMTSKDVRSIIINTLVFLFDLGIF